MQLAQRGSEATLDLLHVPKNIKSHKQSDTEKWQKSKSIGFSREMAVAIEQTGH